MFEVHFFEEKPITIEAHSFDTNNGNVTFYTKLGGKVAFISKEVVKYVIAKGV